MGFLALAPGHPLDLLHPVLLGRALELGEEGFERREGEEHRLVQRFVQRRAGEGAGLLIPLGDVELIVEGDQRRGHGVDDVVQVVLEAGELLLDLAAHLHFQLQLAVGVAGFLGQALGLGEGALGVVAGALELLFARLHAAEHGVEGIGQAADLVLVAARGAQGIVLLAGDLARQLFQLADRAGDEAANLPRDQRPEQQAEGQDHRAGGDGAGVEGAGQFAGRHQQQAPGDLARLRQVDQVSGAKLALAPVFQLLAVFRQLQRLAQLQLGQADAAGIVEGGSAQRRIAVEALQQLAGGAWRGQGAAAQLRAGDQPAEGLQGLGRDAFLGNPVGRTDEGQVGHQQHGGQQYQQGGQQLAADRQVVEALAQTAQGRGFRVQGGGAG